MMAYYRTSIQLVVLNENYNNKNNKLIFLSQSLTNNASILNDDFLWEGRMLASVGDMDDSSSRFPAIIEFDSLRGVSSISLLTVRDAISTSISLYY